MKKYFLVFLAFCLFISCAAAENGDSDKFSYVRINEFMASNGDSLKDARGESPDWIELYNTGDEDINLKGLCLSDGKKTLDKFVFPDWVLPARGYLIVFASGTEYMTEDEIHVGFKLSAEGERVVLSYNGEILDIVSFDAQEKDVSMSRYDSRTWRFTENSTPGAENNLGD